MLNDTTMPQHDEAFEAFQISTQQRANAFQACQTLVRSSDPDRFFANLFTPLPQRDALYALYAFNAEIARTRDVISDPMPGEIRLQWWRDAIMGEAHGDMLSHPIAAALIDTIQTYRLPRQPFLALIDARTFDLYNEPMPTLHDLEGYCGETCSILIQLACLILNHSTPPHTADAAGHAGVAYALTHVLRHFARHTARGQIYLPSDILEQNGVSVDDILSRQNMEGQRMIMVHMRHIIRSHLQKVKSYQSHITPSLAPAFLPMSLIEPYLKALEKSDDTIGQTTCDLYQWRKQWILWRSSKNSTFI